MPDNLVHLLQSYHEAVAQILGSRLEKVILYGSYARGDFTQDSDLDIMILADVRPEELSGYADRIYDITYDFEMRYDMEINPSIQSVQIYERWKKTYPFYRNVDKDGVAV